MTHVIQTQLYQKTQQPAAHGTMKTKQAELLKKEPRDSLQNVRRMLVDQNEKLFNGISSYSNCARIYDDTSQAYKDWQKEYEEKCRKIRAEMDGIDLEIFEIDKLLNEK